MLLEGIGMNKSLDLRFIFVPFALHLRFIFLGFAIDTQSLRNLFPALNESSVRPIFA